MWFSDFFHHLRHRNAKPFSTHGAQAFDDILHTLNDQNIITDDQMNTIQTEMQRGFKSFESIMHQFVDETVLFSHIAHLRNVPFINFSNENWIVLHDLPADIAEQHRVLALTLQNSQEIWLAMADVDDLQAYRQASRFFPTQTLKASVISPSVLMEIIGQNLPQQNAIRPILSDREALHDMNTFVRVILSHAVRQKASDIHLEPHDFFISMRFRLNGTLQNMGGFHRKHWSMMTVGLKILASMDIAHCHTPQDGRFSQMIDGREIDFRLSIHPTVHGENIVLRVLDKKHRLISLESLGYGAQTLQTIESTLTKPDGLTVVTGPTGSGKTTTLYAMLMKLNAQEKNIMTLEDPVEYKIDNIRQTSMDQAQTSFADGIRSILRQGPDVILVGEIRDSETMNMAFRAVMTGHQVFTTLHTQDCVGAFMRLLDLGIKPDVMAQCLRTVIAQRLVRILCSNCKKEDKQHSDGLFFKPCGCASCHFTGYAGRSTIAEILTMDAELTDLISSKIPRLKIMSHLRQKGFISLRENAFNLAVQGEISLSEVEKVKSSF